MPLPIVSILAALAAGGTLVPHAAGGMIVTSTAGYVAGTYLSTAAISTIIYTVGGSAVATLGMGTAAVTGAAGAIIGGAGIFGTSIGATGLTSMLMSVGLVSSTPIIIPIACLTGIASIGVIGLRAAHIRGMKRRLAAVPEGIELEFSEKDAKRVEKILKWFGKKLKSKKQG